MDLTFKEIFRRRDLEFMGLTSYPEYMSYIKQAAFSGGLVMDTKNLGRTKRYYIKEEDWTEYLKTI